MGRSIVITCPNFLKLSARFVATKKRSAANPMHFRKASLVERRNVFRPKKSLTDTAQPLRLTKPNAPPGSWQLFSAGTSLGTHARYVEAGKEFLCLETL